MSTDLNVILVVLRLLDVCLMVAFKETVLSSGNLEVRGVLQDLFSGQLSMSWQSIWFLNYFGPGPSSHLTGRPSFSVIPLASLLAWQENTLYFK